MRRQLRRRVFNGKVLVAFLIFAIIWCIYVKTFSYKLSQEMAETRSNDDLADYPSDREHPPQFILEKLQKDLHKAHDPNEMEKLKEMLKGHDLSKDVEFEEDFLRAYIMSNNHSSNEAFTKIINFLNLRIDHDELFHNIGFDFTQNPAYRFIFPLPHRNKDGSFILFLEVGKWNPDDVPLEHIKRLLFTIHMQELRNPLTQAHGFSTIIDAKDVGFKHLQLASPQNLRLLSHVAFEVIPAVFSGIHIVNLNFFANLLMPLIRQLMPSHIEKVFYVHSSPEELLNFFPVSALPAEYGGELTEFYAADWLKRANEQNDNYPPGGQKNVL